ncbi:MULTISPECIES: hypothetical protein [unclassified Arthrobacter]|uniref:hypothetical protein n=1 Tax=unclassified Arthrobacter TaxID=235627 RepID=UPI001D514376|nr:hypothetical protein [Arthrobacter sp. Bi26]CAH0180874.1 hypothetical protein SRABI26_01430 [Arthrobacter sp. Bi26]
MSWKPGGAPALHAHGEPPRSGPRFRRWRRGWPAAVRVWRAGASAALATALAFTAAPGATADSAPADPSLPSSPVTVTADSLPTVQVDGVVWQQTVIADTVYAVGKFSTARPAGAPAGTQTTARKNILAFSLTTGKLITSFTASLNAQALAVTASPDHKRLYVGGDFTQVNGHAVRKVAALDPATGALIPGWAPPMSGSVRAIVATPATVYLGGSFTAVGSAVRSRLAAVRASDGGLLAWKPAAGGGRVNALVLAPDRSRVVVGGAFTTLNGSSEPGFGLGAVDPVGGKNLPTPANEVVRNAGTYAAITSLSSDGTSWYGTAFILIDSGGTGNLEGSFAANWSNLAIKWIDDCRGDSYSTFASSTAVYKAGHSHDCGKIDGFPETDPRSWHRALAYSKAATGTLTRPSSRLPSFTGQPMPTLLVWFPDMDTGTATGQNQGPWTVAGNDQYVVMGGEFLNVNLRGQQGLARFAVTSIAPNKEGPRSSAASTNPVLASPSSGTISISWQANWDRDNSRLNYKLYRDGKIISTRWVSSRFWYRPTMQHVDSVPSGTTHEYKIVANDSFGNAKTSATVSLKAR